VPKYYYTEIPGIIPTPFPGDARTAGPAIITNPRVLMEHQLMDFKVTAYRADLVDGRRVFRILARFLERIPLKDVNGHYIELMKVKYYWTATNPVTENDAYLNRWGPL
jgi:hypothetical protein